MAIMARPAGVPSNIWIGYEKSVLIPYIQKHAARLRRGLVEQDINYLTGSLSNMLERSGISGLGQEEKIPPTPEKKGIDWGGMVENLFKAVPKVAESFLGYKLGKEALKVEAGRPVPKPTAVIISEGEGKGEGIPWMTIGIVAVVGLGGYLLLRRLKYI